MFPWHQYLLGFLMVLAGANHIRIPKLYTKIIPPYLKSPQTLVFLSGILEMIMGFMLMTASTQKIAAWGIMVLMVLYIPIHIYMLQEKNASLKLPRWVLIIRLPLQLLFIYWAFQYT